MSRSRYLQYVLCAVAHGNDTASTLIPAVTDWVLFLDPASRTSLGLRAIRRPPVSKRTEVVREVNRALTESRTKRLVIRVDEMLEDEPQDEGKYGVRVKFLPAPYLWRQGAHGPERCEYVAKWQRYVDPDGVVASWDGLFSTEGQVVKRSGK